MPRRPSPRHLERRPSGRFHWRRRWPRTPCGRDAAPSGRRFLRFPLRVDLRIEAEILAHHLTALSDRVFAALTETAMPIAPELAETLLIDRVRFEIAAVERARAVAPTRSLEALELDRARERATEKMLRRALALRDREPVLGPLRAAARRLDVALDEAGDDWRALAVEATKALIEVSRERGRRDGGLHEALTRAFRGAIGMEAEAGLQPTSIALGPSPEPSRHRAAQPLPFAAAAEPTTEPPVSTEGSAPACPDGPAPETAGRPAVPSHTVQNAEKSGRTLDRMFRRYGEARCAGKAGKEPDERADPAEGRSYRRNSFGNLEGTRKLIVALVGDRPITDLTEADLAEAVQAVPAIHGKSRSETRTIREIIDETDADEREAKHRLRVETTARGESPGNVEAAQHQASVPRLRANTVYRHMQDTQRVIRHAIGMDLLDRNLMARTMWAREQLAHQDTLQEGNERGVLYRPQLNCPVLRPDSSA